MARRRVELAGRIEALPVPSEEWRDLIADLAGRLDALRTDEWRPELAEVAENLRMRVERVEQAHRAPPRPRSSPSCGRRWTTRSPGSRRSRSRPRSGDTEISQVAEGLSKRVERIEEGMIGQARAAAVTEIAEQVGELARKVSATDVLEARLQALGAQIDALPGSTEAWREPLAHLASRIEEFPVASDEWREQIADLIGRVDGLRTDEWRPELAQVAENLRVRVETIEREVASAQAEQLDGLRTEVAELKARIDAVPISSDEIRAQLAELAGPSTDGSRTSSGASRTASPETRSRAWSRALDELAAG